MCEVKKIYFGKILFSRSRKKTTYVLYLYELPTESHVMYFERKKWIWHERVCYVSKKTISKLPKLDQLCETCINYKQVKSSFHLEDIVPTKNCLELLPIDLFGPVKIANVSGKRYDHVIVDDYSRFTWALFLKHKDDSFEAFQNLYKKVQNEKQTNIISI